MILPVLRVLAGISGRTLGTALSYGLRALCPAGDARVRAAEDRAGDAADELVSLTEELGLYADPEPGCDGKCATGECVCPEPYDDDPVADCHVPNAEDFHEVEAREGVSALRESQVRADGFSLRDLSVLGNAATGIEMWAAGKPCGWAAPWLRVADAVRALQASVAPDTRLPGSDAATERPAPEPPPATGAGQPSSSTCTCAFPAMGHGARCPHSAVQK